MVADRHPLVVRQQRVVGAQHLPDVRGVEDRGVEVAVVADLRRQEHLDVGLAQQHLRRVGARGDEAALGAQQVAEPVPQRPAHPWLEGHEGVEARPAAAVLDVGRHPAQEPPLGAGGEIEDLVADRAADPRRPRAAATEDAERQVLDGEVGGGVVRRLDPAAQRRVVRAVGLRYHGSTPRERRSATGSAKEHEPKDDAKSRRDRASSAVATRR